MSMIKEEPQWLLKGWADVAGDEMKYLSLIYKYYVTRENHN